MRVPWNFSDSRRTNLSLDEFLVAKEATGVSFFTGKEQQATVAERLRAEHESRRLTLLPEARADVTEVILRLCSRTFWLLHASETSINLPSSARLGNHDGSSVLPFAQLVVSLCEFGPTFCSIFDIMVSLAVVSDFISFQAVGDVTSFGVEGPLGVLFTFVDVPTPNTASFGELAQPDFGEEVELNTE